MRAHKTRHEVRDGIHGFIVFDNTERALIDSRPYQRLRSVHQLALTYQLYPGATHRRFEHCLGVMEVASRIFDRIIPENGVLPDGVRQRVSGELTDERRYWRRVLRAAALLHDLGHLPFSHAAEKELLPDGWDHERLTVEIIRNSEIAQILGSATEVIKVEDVIDLAWSPKDRRKSEPGHELSPWKSLLNEIITGNSFGADRIDYLLRDSWHAGVAYGRFDPDRLIGGLQVIVAPDTDDIAIGLDEGAIHAAEALLLARYFMYTQVYMHEVRRIYDLHLQRFLQSWLPGGKFETDWVKAVAMTDDEVLTGMREACGDPASPHYLLAKQAMSREHFRTVYSLSALHKKHRPTIVQDLQAILEAEFGAERIAVSQYTSKSELSSFFVALEGNELQPATEFSSVIANVPPIDIGFIFADQSIQRAAMSRIETEVASVLSKPAKPSARKKPTPKGHP